MTFSLEKRTPAVCLQPQRMMRRCESAAAKRLFAFFWGSIALFKDVHERFWGLPLWFWVAVCGGYVLSVLVVMFIVKRYFKAMPLDMVPEERAFAGNHEDSSAEKAAQ